MFWHLPKGFWSLWLCIGVHNWLICGSVSCKKTEVPMCKTRSMPEDCDMSQGGSDWELHANLCVDQPSCSGGCRSSDDIYEAAGGIRKCTAEKLDYKKVNQHAVHIRDNHMLPMLCEDPEDTIKMAQGIVLLKGGFAEVAVRRFTKLLREKEDDPCAAFYFGRGMAYSKMGLDDTSNAAHALSDYTKALRVARSQDILQIYETRADVFSALGKYDYAVEDYTEALKLLPSYHLYLMRGVSLVFMERFSQAREDIEEALRLEPGQVIAMQYLTTCLYHMRRFDEAIAVFKSILQLSPDNTEVLQGLAQTYKEIGNFKLAIEYYNKAVTLEPGNAILHQRLGRLLYSSGKYQQALESFKNCAIMQPYNEFCKYMKGVCYTGMGQFYPAIKELTKATNYRPIRQPQGEYVFPSVIFLREWCRYIHSHLDERVTDANPDDDFSAGFKEAWAKDVLISVQNYTEQPGLQPQIKDIIAPDWEKQPEKRRRLLCHAYQIGKGVVAQSMYFADEIIDNSRLHIIAGLAVVEVSQTVREFWAAPKSFRNKQGKKYTWRDAFDICVKWLRFFDINMPVFWMDNLESSSKPFNHQFVVIQGNQTMTRYEKYLAALHRLLAEESPGPTTEHKYKGSAEPTDIFTRLLYNQKEYSESPPADPVIVKSSKVQSKKDKSQKTLEGINVLLQFDRQQKVTLVFDAQLTWPKTKQYHTELDYLWQKIADDHKKLLSRSNGSSSNTTEALINLILSLSFYFFNLMPMSEYSSGVTYYTAVGLILALGRETVGKIPKGREIGMDALTVFDPEKFKSLTRSWLSFKKSKIYRPFDCDMLKQKCNSKRRPSNLENEPLENVAESFPTYRSMLDIVNCDLARLCTSL